MILITLSVNGDGYGDAQGDEAQDDGDDWDGDGCQVYYCANTKGKWLEEFQLKPPSSSDDSHLDKKIYFSIARQKFTI